jgi:hypothetical protein
MHSAGDQSCRHDNDECDEGKEEEKKAMQDHCRYMQAPSSPSPNFESYSSVCHAAPGVHTGCETDRYCTYARVDEEAVAAARLCMRGE